MKLITPQDDQLGHQTSDTFGKVAWSDTRTSIYTERFWYMGTIIPEGDFVFGMGLGYYPNRGVMDCYAAVSSGGWQHNFRASRTTGSDAFRPSVGPLQIQVLSGLDRHRLVVAPNDSKIALDLEFVAATHPHDEGREVVEHNGKTLADVRRFVQAGVFEGSISVGQRTVQVTADSTVGFRDRSWGLRVEARTDESTPPVSRFPPIFYFFMCVQFETYSLHIFFKESAPENFRFLAGDLNRRSSAGAFQQPLRVKNVEHDLAWKVGAMSQELAGGKMNVAFSDGTARSLLIEAMDGRLFLKGGLYGGLNGWFQGDDRGPLYVEHNSWNFTSADDRRVARTLAEQVVRVRDGDSVGFGTIQCGVGRGYPRYLEVQDHPAQ